MSRRAVPGRTLALVLVLELAVGAFIWFRNAPSASAQPGATGSGSAAETDSGSASLPSPSPAPAPGAARSPAEPTPGAPAAVPAPDDKTKCPAKPKSSVVKRTFGQVVVDDLLPIGLLILVIVFVVARLPRVELGHTRAFRSRRLLNWLPLGLTYSFLYFGRYNIKQFQGIGLTEAEYGTVFGVGSMVYGLSFLLNGPLTDRWGGRTTILISAGGAGAMNLLMGYMAATGNTFGMSVPTAFTVAYAGNMYFQSFGAVSIVKVNAAWFHTRERGTFGGIFGILISLGLYFAYDVGARIKENFAPQWIFLIPSMLLCLFFVLSFLFVRNEPGDTGHANFDLGDATNDNEKASVKEVFIRLFTHPVILTISFIELCSGFLRQAILQWGVDFGKGIGLGGTFVFKNWGLVSCIAGITGGVFAGAISDHLFQSRRSPVSGVLYGIMLAGSIMIIPLFTAPAAIGWIVALMSMAIIGVHGMLTATASADFAGKKNTGMAVGIIDGFVYVGSTVQSFLYGAYLPASKIRDASGCVVANPEAGKVDNWTIWPLAMMPVALVGFLLTLRIWNAKPRSGGGGGH
jgi:OPA family glycerol-3-phosphate transporter-like MFS transporter